MVSPPTLARHLANDRTPKIADSAGSRVPSSGPQVLVAESCVFCPTASPKAIKLNGPASSHGHSIHHVQKISKAIIIQSISSSESVWLGMTRLEVGDGIGWDGMAWYGIGSEMELWSWKSWSVCGCHAMRKGASQLGELIEPGRALE